MLPKDKIGDPQVLDVFFKGTIPIQEKLFDLWGLSEKIYLLMGNPEKEQRQPLSQWVIEGAIKVLNSSEWIQYTPNTIRNLLNICASEKDRFISICQIKGINEIVAESISKCICNFTEDISPPEVDCGILRGKYFLANWSNAAIPKQLESIPAKQCLQDVQGAFHLMLTCVSFAKDQTDAALVDFIHAVDVAGKERIGALPNFLLALLPIPGQFTLKPYDIEHLRSIKAGTTTKGISIAKEQNLQPPYDGSLMVKEEKNSTLQDWQTLATHLPSIAPNLLFAMASGKFLSYKKIDALSAISSPEIINILLNNPDLTCANILDWGCFKESAPDFLNKLKKIVTPTLLLDKIILLGNIPGKSGFPLALPKDASLLPLIAQALISSQYRKDQIFLEKRNLSLENILSSYSLDAKKLRSIAESESSDYSQSSRAAALALYWMSLAEPTYLDVLQKLDLEHEKVLFTKLVDEGNEKWLTQALIKGVLINLSETDANVIAFVTFLLERCIEGGEAGDEIIDLLANWRERSTAPVSSKGILNNWLGYSFEPPNYGSPSN